MRNFDFKVDNKLYKIELFAQLLMDSNPQYIFWKDVNGVYLGCNKLYAYFCDIPSPTDIVGTTDYDYMKAEEAKICLAADAEILKQGDAMLNFEEYVTNAHGESRWYNINKVPLRDINNEVIGILGTMEDVTEKKQNLKIIEETTELLKIKNDLLHHKNEELQKYIESNMQLENFAYVTSHDLRGPLKTIIGFAQLLDKKYAEGLDESAKMYLSHIIKSGESMNKLVEDLLNFSKVTTDEHKIETIDLQELLDDIKLSLDNSIQATNTQVIFENIPPTIQANRTKMKQLFQNLIANAIKFHKPDAAPEIVIDCEAQKDFWKFSVQDNGIGISKANQHQIFSIFKRFHTEKEHDGTGIGLSLCKKIVEQHGGEIYLDSTLGKGTTFYFTIAK